MARFLMVLVYVILLLMPVSGQMKPQTSKFPAGVPVKETGIEATGGQVEERTFIHKKLGFQITVPEDWFIAGPDFEKVIKDKGYDLRADPTAGATNRAIDILMTAFRSETGSGGAVLRVTAEDLKGKPQICDAVDYFDAITAAYVSAKLPTDFVYSSTKAEKLGSKQFAFLDTASNAGKKRMYATVIDPLVKAGNRRMCEMGRTGIAIMFTLSYSNDNDLQAFRRILETSNFEIK